MQFFASLLQKRIFFLVKLTCVTNWLLWFDEKRNNFGLSCNRKRKSKLTNGLDPFFVFHFLVVHQLTSTSAFFRKFATKRLRILSSFWHSIYIRTISSNRFSYVVVHLFPSWLVWDRNWVYFARYSAKKAHKQIRRFGDSKVDKRLLS